MLTRGATLGDRDSRGTVGASGISERPFTVPEPSPLVVSASRRTADCPHVGQLGCRGGDGNVLSLCQRH